MQESRETCIFNWIYPYSLAICCNQRIQIQTKVRYILLSLDSTENSSSQLTFLRATKTDVGYTLNSYHHKQVTALAVDYVSTRCLRASRQDCVWWRLTPTLLRLLQNMARCVHFFFYHFVSWFNYSRLDLPTQPQTSRNFCLWKYSWDNTRFPE